MDKPFGIWVTESGKQFGDVFEVKEIVLDKCLMWFWYGSSLIGCPGCKMSILLKHIPRNGQIRERDQIMSYVICPCSRTVCCINDRYSPTVTVLFFSVLRPLHRAPECTTRPLTSPLWPGVYFKQSNNRWQYKLGYRSSAPALMLDSWWFIHLSIFFKHN